MATTVGFISEKGGVGKTTACYHLAVALSGFGWREKKRVLVVDTDYQRGGLTCRMFPNLIEGFGAGKISEVTLFDKFQFLYSGSTITTSVDILKTPNNWWTSSVIPADPRLAQVTVEKIPATNNIRENTRKLWDHLKLIDDVLEPLRGHFDYILIDSHPELSDLLRSVVYACDYCVSPVKLDLQSTIGVPSALQAIHAVNDDMEMIRAAVGNVDGFVPTQFAGAIGMMAREYRGDLKESEQSQYVMLKRTGGIFESYITEGDGLRQAAEQRCPVFDLVTANAKKQSNQFKLLTKEFIKKCPPK